MLQEPPKHVYWDERAKRVVNLTRSDGNNVHLYNALPRLRARHPEMLASRAATTTMARIKLQFGILKPQDQHPKRYGSRRFSVRRSKDFSRLAWETPQRS